MELFPHPLALGHLGYLPRPCPSGAESPQLFLGLRARTHRCSLSFATPHDGWQRRHPVNASAAEQERAQLLQVLCPCYCCGDLKKPQTAWLWGEWWDREAALDAEGGTRESTRQGENERWPRQRQNEALGPCACHSSYPFAQLQVLPTSPPSPFPWLHHMASASPQMPPSCGEGFLCRPPDPTVPAWLVQRDLC